MRPARRRRLLWVLTLAIAGALTTTLAALALQRNVAYLYTPSEVLRGEAGQQSRFRLGGMVAKGSFQRRAGSLRASFQVSDGDAQLTVHYDRILPDLFAEGQAVIASGHLEHGVFIADQVLAKHDETYTPKEVSDKISAAHRKHAAAAEAGR